MSKKTETCRKCHGRGEHLNPHWSYCDIKCETCGGSGLVKVPIADVEKFNEFVRNRRAFSYETFGSPKYRGAIPPLNKLLEEVSELIAKPHDTMEWADCLLLFLDAADRQGYSVDDLIDFSNEKLKINKTRKWRSDEHGVFSHVDA